jgi:hypothetical protein
MKKIIIISLLILSFIHGCKKDDQPPLSGTETINNDLFGTQPYYAIGFSFSLGEKLSTLNNPPPDITIDNDNDPQELIFEANNRNNSFFMEGEYASTSEAILAFNNLTSIDIQESQWSGIGYHVRPNQIWIYRSGSEHYTKLRIISTKAESRSPRNYAECTFEWVYQPDGSLTFHGR